MQQNTKKEPKGSFLLDKNTKLMYNGGKNYEKEKCKQSMDGKRRLY